MRNKEIIENKAKEIYGEELVNAWIKAGKEIPLFSKKQWKKKGYKIKEEANGYKVKINGKNKTKYYMYTCIMYALHQVEQEIQ